MRTFEYLALALLIAIIAIYGAVTVAHAVGSSIDNSAALIERSR